VARGDREELLPVETARIQGAPVSTSASVQREVPTAMGPDIWGAHLLEFGHDSCVAIHLHYHLLTPHLRPHTQSPRVMVCKWSDGNAMEVEAAVEGLFACLINCIFLVNELCFSLVTNQRTIFLAMAFQLRA
jgi:hypothetical protein